MWNEIITKEDVNDFMRSFNYFHDSCIKEIRYISGAFVSEDLFMQPFNDSRTVDIIFQRQYKYATVIVVSFIGTHILHLAPYDENCTCGISGATMFFSNERIYWADCDGLENRIESYDGTWICADKIKWRVINACVGNDDIFPARFESL